MKRIIAEVVRPLERKGREFRIGGLSVFVPRLWLILLVAAVPLFMICAKCLEALEKTGSMGAIIAGMLMNVSIIAYAALLYILKKRKI